jgi:hypothetical protein
MAQITLVDSFLLGLAEAKHDINAHTFRVVLTNTTPDVEFEDLSDLTPVDMTGLGGNPVVTLSASINGTTHRLEVDLDEYSFLATGVSVGPYRQMWIYNDSVSGDPLVGWLDRGAPFTLEAGQSLRDDPTEPLFTIGS